MKIIVRALCIGALGLATACGGGQANAGASVNSDGTVNADANASVDTPAGSAGVGASATAGGGSPTPVPASQGGYTATTVPQGCVEEWVHMPLIINFPSGGAIIDAQNRAVLQEMVRSAQSRDDISAVRVEGHTDHCGNEANNMALSQQRAVAVANELVTMGVPRERITTVGYGSTMPRANEQCDRRAREELSRNMNRRVEFSLLVCR
ncbi:MAG TPA: OmpA family protein [Sandaracinaceae bacterium LLY-WYZ-13_1]|nr:OmpA family protein [Sandaracinaceae bacterium LLY-WYZ-13_1]